MLRSTVWTIALVCIALACAGPEPEPAPEPAPAPAPAEEAAPAPTATAQLQGAEGSGITGEVVFTETEDGVRVTAHVMGVPAGTHGFHVHETGDCSAPDFSSAGGHFNPDGVAHGGPDTEVHHAGDLGNIEVGEDGMGHLEMTSDRLTVSPGMYSVVGLAVILHADPDDLVSQPTGAAGARLACGLVEGGAGGAMMGDETMGGEPAGEMPDDGGEG